jgi:DNA-binding transcriptional ArsR family regulator
MNEKNVVIRMEYIDVETGEYISKEVKEEELIAILDWKNKKRNRSIIKHFYGEKIMIFQAILKKAVKELSNDELKVFNYMLGIMDFENWIHIPQKELAKDIGLHITNVSKAIKGLEKKGYIEVYKKGRSNYYRINPEIAWKGKEKGHIKVLKKNNPLL